MSPARSVISRTLTWDATSGSAAAAAAEALVSAAEATSAREEEGLADLAASPGEVVAFKLLSLVVVVIISLLGSFLPLRLSSLSDSVRHTVMEQCRFFTAGVFLGVGLLHMLPEAAEGFEALMHPSSSPLSPTSNPTSLSALTSVLPPSPLQAHPSTFSAAGLGAAGPQGLLLQNSVSPPTFPTPPPVPESIWADFPMAYAICCLGFVAVWFVEKRVLSAPTEGRARTDSDEEHRHGMGVAPLLASDCDPRRMVAVAAGAESQGGASLCVVHVSSVASYGPHSCHPAAECPHTSSLPRPNGQAAPATLPSAAGCTQCCSASPAEASHGAPGTRQGRGQGQGQGQGQGHSRGAAEKHEAHRDADSEEEGEEEHIDAGALHGADCQHGERTSLLSASVTGHGPSASHRHRKSEPGQPRERSPSPCESCPPGEEGNHHQWKSRAWSGVAGGSADDVCDGLHQHTHAAHHHHIVLHGRGAVSLLLAVLFSLHSFVVGAALGTETHMSGAVSLIIAVVAHKGAEAFAVGVQFVKEGVPVEKMVVVMLIYCAMTPLGILLGMAAGLVQGPGGALIANTTQAFGAGTVLYIVMVELAEGTSSSVGAGMQLFLLMTGLCIMAAVSVFV